LFLSFLSPKIQSKGLVKISSFTNNDENIILKTRLRFKCKIRFPFQELEIISYVKDNLTGALRNARDQLEANREAKHRLEMDWSDKVLLHLSFNKKRLIKNRKAWCSILLLFAKFLDDFRRLGLKYIPRVRNLDNRIVQKRESMQSSIKIIIYRTDNNLRVRICAY
jgi:hypothetical protein